MPSSANRKSPKLVGGGGGGGGSRGGHTGHVQLKKEGDSKIEMSFQ